MSEEQRGEPTEQQEIAVSPDTRQLMEACVRGARLIFDANPGLSKALDTARVFNERFPSAVAEFLKSDFMTQLTETIVGLKEANEKRAEKYPQFSRNLEEIANQGWFLSLHMDFPSYEQLAFSLDYLPESEGRWEALDKAFSNHYSKSIDYYLDCITSRYPERGFAIRPAVAAHLRGEYALSVPVFFSQAEGVLRDETQRELFTKKGHISNYAQDRRGDAPDGTEWFGYFDDAVWAPLCGDLPIAWGPGQREKVGYKGLNRNTTLHGIDLGYATEVNSLKAFSLLCYVAGLFDEDDQIKE
ncbi:hypothetical protein ACF8C1_12170 [Pseudomonas sp. zjy_9]